jgi:hypothetical protein
MLGPIELGGLTQHSPSEIPLPPDILRTSYSSFFCGIYGVFCKKKQNKTESLQDRVTPSDWSSRELRFRHGFEGQWRRGDGGGGER